MAIIKRKGIRRRTVQLQDKDTSLIVGELSRDVDQLNDASVPMLIRQVVNECYTEPFSLALPYNPEAIMLMSIMRTRDPEIAPVLSGGFCEYFWRANKTGGFAEIRSIDGLTPSDVRYSFKFLIVGRHESPETI